MAEVILLYDAIKGPPILNLTPQDARQQLSAQDAAKIIARGTGRAETPISVGKIQDGLTIDGPDGNQIPIRIYTPPGAGPFPVVLYFHGGGETWLAISNSSLSDGLHAYTGGLLLSKERGCCFFRVPPNESTMNRYGSCPRSC